MSHTDLKQWLFRKADRSNPIDNPKIYYATTAILLIFLGLTFWKKPKIEGTSVNQEVAESLDLLIPKGMTAYPIPLENAEALTGMVQDFVVVDLYSASSNPPTRKLASSVRLIRAPYATDQFVALLPSDKVGALLEGQDLFRALIVPRAAPATEIESSRPDKPSNFKRRIISGGPE